MKCRKGDEEGLVLHLYLDHTLSGSTVHIGGGSWVSHRILGLPVSFPISPFSTIFCGIGAAGKVGLQIRRLGALQL